MGLVTATVNNSHALNNYSKGALCLEMDGDN